MPEFSSPDDFQKASVSLYSPDGGSARISPYGAQVLSWITADGAEQLYLSPRSEYHAGKAIRGGVPVIFPQFAGLGNLPKHGFARVLPWDVMGVGADTAVFNLGDSAATKAYWPAHFLAEIAIRVTGQELEITFKVSNVDKVPLTFTAALHTYLRVQDLSTAAVVGLQGLAYRDTAAGGIEQVEAAGKLNFSGEVDRIYFNAPEDLHLVDGERRVLVHSQGFADAVIWNPGAEKCAALPDMEPEGYRQFVCVEAAAIGRPIRLEPGEKWRGSQRLSGA